MSFKLLLGVGTLVMFLIMLFTCSKYSIAWWKSIILSIALLGLGLLGTRIMSYIESGDFSNRSFFGAVFFTPLLMIPVGLILKIKPLDTLDLCAPTECAMSALMKVNCYISDCCIGRVMYVTEHGKEVRFPSQIVECVAALLIMLFLLVLVAKNMQRGYLYFLYMIIYGVVRFGLNLLRETTPFVWILPAGNFWALISFALGIMILFFLKRSNNIRKEAKG